MMNVQQLHDHLIHQVFARIIAGDPERIDALARADGGMRFVDRDLLFTLPALLRFLVLDFERSGHAPLDPAELDYKVLRRMLYQNPTNAALRRFGAVVVVEHADDDHALSLYRLTRCPA
jgi:hypothetical protein